MSYLQLKRLTIVWIAAVILGSISPPEVKEAVGTETKSDAPALVKKASRLHQVAHIIMFGVGAALLTAVSLTRAQRITSCVALMLLGCALEWLQYAAFGSKCLETWDMRDDAIAVVAGFSLASIMGFGARSRAQLQQEKAVTL